ncbi:MAG: Transcriptional regulator, HxlR family [uncultured Acidimicrobiales bacterium]|uniref:Transcriptional regulator, HxlR family n=1 Tax=uncultured Acidimicrobiales bacterium TaxID=310071 RepID=A0A6J4IUY7_9ACTN|nr:MAG: Transcriptional regulator, HxlR family [uncultured Acidimicrobiales bacterium]
MFRVVPDQELGCSIASTLEVIGDRWSILILRDAFRGVRRFDDIQRDLGIARNILTDRLQKLVDNEVLERRLYQSRPARYEYRLTPRGVDLSPALVALMHWGDRHLAGEAGPAVVLTHGACGEPVDQTFVCWTCDQTILPTAIRSRPGPGARKSA